MSLIVCLRLNAEGSNGGFHPQSQSWLKSVGHTTDQNDMNMGKELVGVHNPDGGMGVLEAMQNVLYTWIKLSKNKEINKFLKFEF